MKNYYNHIKRMTGLAAMSLLIAAGLVSCDTTGLTDTLDEFGVRIDVEDIDIDFGAGVTAQVTPGEATIQTQDISNGLSVKSVDSIENLKLAPSMFAFTSSGSSKSTASSKSLAPSGVIKGYLTLGGFPIPGTPVQITVTDGAVTAVSPSTLLGPNATLDLSAYEAYLNLLPANQRPNLNSYESLSIDEIRQRIATALSGTRIPISFGLTVESSDPNDPLSGSLSINKISFSGNVTAQ
jgi:hypothetical protein